MKENRNIITLSFLIISFIMGCLIHVSGVCSADIVGTGRLQIGLEETGSGITICSISDNGTELLNPAGECELFALHITNPDVNRDILQTATEGWTGISIENNGTDCVVTLTNPTSPDLPDALTASITIHAAGTRSQWDISISSLGNCTLMQADVPQFNIQAAGNDYFLYPRYSGILIDDPVENNIAFDEVYPAGWHASMQFLSYYNASRGIYFGFHDPRAGVKHFAVETDAGGVMLQGRYPIPDASLPGNDWGLPGVFEFDVFNGDWYDAAQIYRDWVFASADYRPPDDDPARDARLERISNISLWATIGGGADPAVVENQTMEFAEYMDVPVGLTWYTWNYKDFDDDYPEYFPERAGMSDTVTHLKAAGIEIAPYINGRMFDMDLDGSGPSGLDFTTDGEPYCTKDTDGNIFTQTFNGNTFAVMCPTQTSWQDILIQTTNTLASEIGVTGMYIDMVGAARPEPCMVPDHNHALGGGHWWRSGYFWMFDRMHEALPEGVFLTTESGADFLIDTMDGFMVQGWQADKMVPAFQAVYSGHTLLFGMKTGVSQYSQPQFYCKLAQAFAHGIQLGRFFTSIQETTGSGESAPIFVRKLGKLHHKLNRFLTRGKMEHPLSLTGIPLITSTWTYTYDGDIPVTIAAIQTGTWYTADSDGIQKVAVTFVNASMTDSISFAFDFNAADYGLSGHLVRQRITETSDDPVQKIPSVFTENVTLAPLDAVGYVVSTLPACARNGDVTLDGNITAADAQIAFEIALGTYTPDEQEACAADCTGDTVVTARDAQHIFQSALGMASCSESVLMTALI